MKNLIILTLVLILSACGYDDTAAFKHLELPPYTETGANTFGCLVNGAVWANFGENNVKSIQPWGGKHLVANVVRASVYRNITGMDSVFTVSAGLTVSKHGTDTREENMGFSVPKNGNLKGVYQLNNSNYRFDYANLITYTSYVSLIGKTFTVTIKKDTIEGGKHIISGTFSGILYKTQTDSVRITAGVFDTVLP